MKKILAISLSLILTFLVGCSTDTGKEPNTDGEKQISIVTTIFPQYDFSRQITAGQADITMLLKPGSESHSYEPTPQDIKTIENCDLFIYTGGENDVWVEEILGSMGEKKPETLRLIDCVTTVNEEFVEGMEHDHEHEDDHDHEHEDEEDHDHEEEIDEHVWTSPVNAMKIVDRISEKLCALDEENANVYKANTEEYIVQLKELDETFRTVVKDAKRDTLMFGDRFPFRYFADEYHLKYYAAFSGCATDSEASASTIAFLIDKTKEEKYPIVFSIELSNEKIADSICHATGAEKRTFYSCHNVTKDQMEEGVTYLSMMNENVETLRAALN